VNPAELGAIVWDAWRAERGGPAAIAHRQAARLATLVRFAREHSPLYRELYRGLPAGEVRLESLPSVTKSWLMNDFDAWVTDPGVTRAGIREFLADPSLVGRVTSAATSPRWDRGRRASIMEVRCVEAATVFAADPAPATRVGQAVYVTSSRSRFGIRSPTLVGHRASAR